MEQQFSFKYNVIDSLNALSVADQELFKRCINELHKSYSPYSSFKVAALACLRNGKTLGGTNQENASYPVGICAERAMLAVIASLFPHEPIHTLAITYKNEKDSSTKPISPCGMCRQALIEAELRQQQPIRILLGGCEGGSIYIISSAKDLLPLGFTSF